MNIFWLDTKDLQNCARLLPNKLIVKMQLEHCQLLATALQYYDDSAVLTKLNGQPYKSTHRNHPCAKWTRASRQNFQTLCNLTLAIADEYEYRYNKPSSYRPVILQALSQIAILPIEQTQGTFAVAINPFYLKCICDAGIISQTELAIIENNKEAVSDAELVQRCYRAYLVFSKAHYAEWTADRIPDFWARQDGNGRLFCRLKKLSPTKLFVESTYIAPDSAKTETFNELWALNMAYYEASDKSKMSKNKLKQICIDTGFCKLAGTICINRHFFAKAKAKATKTKTKTKTTSTKSKAKAKATIEPAMPTPTQLANCETDEQYRELIKQCIGMKVPTKSTISKWRDAEPNLEARVLGHIEFWLDPDNRAKWG